VQCGCDTGQRLVPAIVRAARQSIAAGDDVFRAVIPRLDPQFVIPEREPYVRSRRGMTQLESVGWAKRRRRVPATIGDAIRTCAVGSAPPAP